ncbi:MAG: hypothetical protein IJ819_00100 [Clostridiales bacterium]|nr:hypothetical protein [Clostridiales bacterium]
MNLLIIQTLNDRTVARNFISFTEGTEVENENAAMSRLYSECAYAASPDTPICKIVAEIISDEGHVKRCERWGSLPPVETDDSDKQPNNAEEGDK